MSQEKKLTGYHVAAIFCTGFALIIGVNLVLAYNAVATFPGLETKNSYVASQTFDADRASQDALGWRVTLELKGDQLELAFVDGDGPVQPSIDQATLGRATHVGEDRVPDFIYENGRFVAPVDLGPGNWNLRLKATAADGTPFRRRLVLHVRS